MRVGSTCGACSNRVTSSTILPCCCARNRTWRLAVLAARGLQEATMRVAIALLLLLPLSAAAQQIQSPQAHLHPPQDAQLHEKFYATWYMPDQPTKPCCNKADCYPTEVKVEDGKIYARRREDGKFLLIPSAKVERNRDNPDGRNHLCAPPPHASYPPDTVFCFAL